MFRFPLPGRSARVSARSMSASRFEMPRPRLLSFRFCSSPVCYSTPRLARWRAIQSATWRKIKRNLSPTRNLVRAPPRTRCIQPRPNTAKHHLRPRLISSTQPPIHQMTGHPSRLPTLKLTLHTARPCVDIPLNSSLTPRTCRLKTHETLSRRCGTRCSMARGHTFL